MLAFNHLLGQLNKIKKEIWMISKFFNLIATFILLGFYTLMLCINLSDLVRIIIYSLLVGITFMMFVIELIVFISSSKGLKHFKNKYLISIYHYTKFAIILASLIYSGYLIFNTSTGSLSLAIFIISVVIYVLSLLLEFTRLLGTHIIDELIVAGKMDLESNALGSVLKETNLVDVDKSKKIDGEDKLRNRIEKETKEYTKNKKVNNHHDDLLRAVVSGLNRYKDKKQVRSALSTPEEIASFYQKKKVTSMALLLNNSVDELCDEIEKLAMEEDYFSNQIDINFVISYVRNKSRQFHIGRALDLLCMGVTCLRILKEFSNPSDYEPLLYYAVNELKQK